MGGPGSGGSNRRSVAEHVQRGTHRPGRHGPLLPAPVLTVRTTPDPPEGLSATSCALWSAIHTQYAMTSAPSLDLLTSALRSRDVAERARETLEREGLTYSDEAGRPKAHPAAAIHRDHRAQYLMAMKALGFPSEDK